MYPLTLYVMTVCGHNYTQQVLSTDHNQPLPDCFLSAVFMSEFGAASPSLLISLSHWLVWLDQH